MTVEPADVVTSRVTSWLYHELYDVIPEGPDLPDGWKAAYDEEIRERGIDVGEEAYVVLDPDGNPYEVEIVVVVSKAQIKATSTT